MESCTNSVAIFLRQMDKLAEEGLKDTFPHLDNITTDGCNQLAWHQS